MLDIEFPEPPEQPGQEDRTCPNESCKEHEVLVQHSELFPANYCIVCGQKLVKVEN